MNHLEVLGTTYSFYELPTLIRDQFLQRIDEYILKATYNLEVFTVLVAQVRDYTVQKVNERERKIYGYIRKHGSTARSTTLRDMAKAWSIKAITEANTAEAQLKRYEDYREVALEKLQTYKKVKKGVGE